MSNTLTPGATALALVKRFEGCEKKLPDGRLKAYPDPGTGGAPWTIGWGSTTDANGRAIAPGTIWTQQQADDRLAAQLRQFGDAVAALVGTAATTAAQFDALVSFAYNVGIANLKSSTLLKLHRAADYGGAARQFSRWNLANGKVLAGLTRRRTAEAAVYQGKGIPA